MKDGSSQTAYAFVYQGYSEDEDLPDESSNGETGDGNDQGKTFTEIIRRGYVIFKNENGGTLKVLIKQEI